ncbi:MAG TPA: molybdopterin-dependent oxidoreductase [Acidimicrobiales bacterium]|nr:molybdopterin-dependent oxidoreductase [Acidimicrobiales bacterium]
MSEHAESNIGKVRVGRRAFIGLAALGAAGIAFGADAQRLFANKLGSIGSLLPGGDHFRIYTITGTLPYISRRGYRLKVSGLVDHPATFSLAQLEAMPSYSMVKDFQCVTGWRVPGVHWKGVQLSHLLSNAGVQPSAGAVSFDSYDGLDTESLTIPQAHLADVIVAYEMLGGPVTREHGGPVRLVVPQMYGYKSLKWLSGIRLVENVEPGYWELNGYPVNGWLDGSTGATNPNPNLT